MTGRPDSNVFGTELLDDLIGLLREYKLDVTQELAALKDDMSRYFLHAQLACTSSRVDAALSSLASVLRMNPNFNVAYLLKARIHLGQGLWEVCQKLHISIIILLYPCFFHPAPALTEQHWIIYALP